MDSLKIIRSLAIILLVLCIAQSCSSPSNGLAETPAENQYRLTRELLEQSGIEIQSHEYSNEKSSEFIGENGGVIIFPSNAWLDQSGNVFTGKVKVEVVEALDRSAILQCGLTTVDNEGNALETGGMLYISAQAGNKKLLVNPKNGPLISIPTEDFDPEMGLYSGELGSDSIIRWKKEGELKKFLTPVNLSDLNFRPQTFDQVLKERLPVGKFKSFSNRLADSLYLASYYYAHEGQEPIAVSEADINDLLSDSTDESGMDQVAAEQVFNPFKCASPTNILSLKNGRFQKTFIATLEFQHRVQTLHNTCKNNDYFKVYINNLDKNLWYCDSLLWANLPNDEKTKPKFESFYKERLTNVKEISPEAKTLGSTLKQLAHKPDKKLKAQYRAIEKARNEDQKTKTKLKKQLKKLKFKREVVHMRRYNYRITSSGWKNVDKPIRQGILSKAKRIVFTQERGIDLTVNYKTTIRGLQAYLSFEQHKTILRLEKAGNNQFRAMRTDNVDLYPFELEHPVEVIVFASNGDSSVFLKNLFIPKPSYDKNIELKVDFSGSEWISYAELKTKLKTEDKYHKRFQSLSQDLKIHTELTRIEKKEAAEREYRQLLHELAQYTIVCCYISEVENFEINCASCHKLGRRFIGPKMAGVNSRWTNRENLIEFIKDSQLYLRNHPEDTYAQQLFKDYNKSVMTASTLSKQEISDILDAIDYYFPNPKPVE